jgi:mRNA interferase HigB
MLFFAMRVIARRTLKEFWERHPQAERPVRAWFSVVTQARWRNPNDVKRAFGTTVDFVGDNRLIFDLAGNRYTLVVHASYAFSRVLVKFVGIDAEYDRIDPETVSWRGSRSARSAPRPTTRRR